MKMLLVIYFLSIVTSIYGYPYKLQCGRPMQVGSVIMGSPAKPYNIRSVLVSRDGVPLTSGSQYTPGETLTVQVSTISSSTGLFKFMFQADGGALFKTGPNIICGGKRVYDLGDGTLGDSTVQMPTTPNTQVNIWVAWATQYGQVFISQNFTLINFPSSQFPTLSPDYKSQAPSSKPSKLPTAKVPTIDTSPKLHDKSGTQQDYTLVLQRQTIPNHFNKEFITVNGTVPGPTLRVKLGQWVNVQVINQLTDDLTLIHWHGFDQRFTPWADGTPGIAQCPINTMADSTNFYSNINSITKMNYRFLADSVGTYWYHGHYNLQYPEGLYGAIVVEDDSETTEKYAALGATYVQETEIIVSDFYESSSLSLATNYMDPESKGYEPVPDYIVVNNMFSQTMQIQVNRNEPLRLRVVNAASMSMFDISVNGMPLKVIELDGNPVEPQEFSYIRVDAGQRVSFILDWSKLDTSLSAEVNIPLKVQAVKSMYKQYDPSDSSNFGLTGSTTEARLYTTWVGQFTFTNDGVANYYYYGASITTLSTAPAPLESNMLQMNNLFNEPPPEADLYMDYNITFTTDMDGIHKYFINGESYNTPSVASPMLFDYMMPDGGPIEEPINLPKYSKINGDANTPFVLPFNRSVTITLRNFDGMSHPIHTHGHKFWIMGTNLYTPVHPIKRDTITVPATGWAKIRFVTDNPGVWFIHCHIDWHMVSGFMSVMVEAPSKLKNTIDKLPSDHRAACPQFFAPTSTPTYLPSAAPMTGSWKPTVLPTPKPVTFKPTYLPLVQSTNPHAGDWSTYGYDNLRSAINPSETKINTITGKRWKKVWRYQLAAGAIMQPVVAINYDFGSSIAAKYNRRNLLDYITPTPNAQPTVAPFSTWKGSLPYDYLGCYADASDRSMSYIGDAVSIAQCYNIASYQGYKYFAVQGGKSCYASNDYSSTLSYGVCGNNSTGNVPMCTCSNRCPSGSGTCGGLWANSVYMTIQKSNPPSLAPVTLALPVTKYPSNIPTKAPSKKPTLAPTKKPTTAIPIKVPSYAPTQIPTIASTLVPTIEVTSANASFTSTKSKADSGYNFDGCYGDSPVVRAFALSYGTLNTIKECYILAVQNNYNFFGIQYGGQCWVTNNYTSATRYQLCGKTSTGAIANCECTMSCTNDIGNCGGSYANAVYTVTGGIPTMHPTRKPSRVPSSNPTISTIVPTAPKPYQQLGCYADSPVDRAFVTSYGILNGIRSCYNIAVTNNFLYFGLQYGGECWVTNSYNNAIKYHQCGPTSTGAIVNCNCDMPCPNGDLLCGGSYSNTVFKVTGSFPTALPTISPSSTPSLKPTKVPSSVPSLSPTVVPTKNPLYYSASPSVIPTPVPTVVAGEPSQLPSSKPSMIPSSKPSIIPTTVAPTGKPTYAPTISIYFSYLGCYGDAFTRAFYLSYGQQKSLMACYQLAYVNNFLYFGMQYGGECWVSNSYASVTQYNQCPLSTGGIKACSCSMPCPNGDKLCGGPFANAVYKLTNPMSSTPTSAPITAIPSMAPVTAVPTKTSVPSSVPITLAPTFSPTRSAPTVKPSTASPTITYRPTQIPTRQPSRAPSSAPVVTLVQNNYVDSTIKSVVYIGDGKGIFHAVDANTGTAIWTRSIGYIKNPLCGDLPGQLFGITASPTFNRTINTIYVSANGTFHALSMKTGDTIWSIPNFYNPYQVHTYGGLNEYNSIVYVTLGAMCDQTNYRGGIYAINTHTRSIQSFFNPVSANPNIIDPTKYGGGVWGIGGVTIGKISASDTDSPLIFIPTGNALNFAENGLFCESVISTDLNLNFVGSNKPPRSTIMGDNDYGSSATLFNIPSEGQTSGCTLSLVSAIRKDGVFTISNAKTMTTIQTIQISASNKPSGIQQAVFDPTTNLLIISNQNGGIGTPYAGKYGNGIIAMRLNSTCGLSTKWYWSGTSNSGITLSGLPGQRVIITVNGYGGNVVDLQTGTTVAQINFGGSAISPPSVANGTMYVGLNDPGMTFIGQAMEAWRPY